MQAFKKLAETLRNLFTTTTHKTIQVSQTSLRATSSGLARYKTPLIILTLLTGSGYLLYKHPPLQNIGRGEIGVRINLATGNISQWRDGQVLVIPGLHDMRVFSIRDQTYQPRDMSQATGSAPLQSVEGLSLGIDLTVRYALDPSRLTSIAKNLPENIGQEIVEPAVRGVLYKTLARYTVREIFSTKRIEIQQTIETELSHKLASDGILLKSAQIGKVDLPSDYRRGMESLLAEELASEKMRYTLELKDKRVKETELDAEADKVRREKAAEA
ncbi:MAG: prohibitin family protein, partial [Betaproteobacteria bacterium]|nr:prohibitin family protein [Betaproteobacteria bacterium]